MPVSTGSEYLTNNEIKIAQLLSDHLMIQKFLGLNPTEC